MLCQNIYGRVFSGYLELNEHSSVQFGFWELIQITYLVQLSVWSDRLLLLPRKFRRAQIWTKASGTHVGRHAGPSRALMARGNIMAKVYLQVIISANRWITAC